MKSFNEHRGAVKESGENELGEALQGISASIEIYRSVIGTANVNADTEKLSAAEKRKLISLSKELTKIQIKIDNITNKMI